MLPESVKESIQRYTGEVQKYTLEGARATRFAMLLRDLFPSLRGLADEWA